MNRFWPSENMRVCAYQSCQRRGLKQTPEINKALRYHYQLLADKGEFSSYTSKELAIMGVDTSTWNEGDGYLPPDFYRREKAFLEGVPYVPPTPKKRKRNRKKTRPPLVLGISSDDRPGDDPVPGPIPDLIEPEPVNISKVAPQMRETVEKIQETGKAFKGKQKIDPSDVPFNHRKWRGEHRDWGSNGPWELKPGHWWNPMSEKWEPGSPKLGPFYWACEFMNDPSKFVNPVKYAGFHKKILEDMERLLRMVVLVARSHLKTTMFNVNHMCYNALERPKLAAMGMLNIAGSPKLALTTFNKVIENLTRNEKILDFYGNCVDSTRSQTKEYIYFTYQGTGADYGIRCTSMLSTSIVGSHPYWVYIDDPTDKAMTERKMATFKDIILKTIIPAVGPRGHIVITGTIKGWTTKNDPYLWLESNKSWRVFRYPAAKSVPELSECSWEWRERQAIDPITKRFLFNEDGTPVMEEYLHVEVKNPERFDILYKERFTIEELIRLRIEMQDTDDKSDDDWWSEYMLQAIDPAGKYFNRKRIGHMPPPGFQSARAFRDYLKEKHKNVFLWIDPGGEQGHGIAVVIGAFYKGRFYFFDVKLIRAPLAKAAEVIGRMLADWEVDDWGVEGNFSQKGTFAEVMRDYLYKYMVGEGIEQYYRRGAAFQSTGEKFQRIQTHISSMIGLDGMDTTMYVNQDAEDFPIFDKQVTSFGLGMPSSQKHQYDVLDAMSCMKINLFGHYRKPVCLAA